jgi:hypothetical protein
MHHQEKFCSPSILQSEDASVVQGLLLDGTQDLEVQIRQFIDPMMNGTCMVMLILNQSSHTHTVIYEQTF